MPMDEIDVAIHLEPMAEAIKELKEKIEFCLLSLNAKVDGIAQLTNERWHCVQQILDVLLERTKPRSNCVFCTVEDNKDQHPTGRCCKYPDAVSRAVQAAALGLCERCLQPKHVEDCGVSCPICTRNHNVLLCPNRGTQAVPMYKRRKICVSIMFCCTRSKKKPGSPYTRREVICKKGLFALMLARVEEFDTLTPLIVTPTSQPAEPTPQLPRPTLPVRRTASDSPPPPRRSSHGKTLIVPLNASRYRTPVIPLLGTPDSRITSFEGGTTKSCATIPEDDENESPSCERIDDLISIDRTTTSASEQKSHRGFCSHSSYNLILPVAPPEFQIPVPSYSPPSVPLSQSRQRQATRAAHHALSPEEPSPCSNSIGSPNSTGSPIDTTGSISDSFYINSDVISSTNGSQVADENGCAESEIQSKYQLHRIEEESEGMDDGNRAVRTVFSQDSLDRERNFVIPRSISEQFELMRQN
ncbi:hypothetical protein Y032_0199g1666 [Ancylostoma ceylanicum]|uniref:Uncharacterized protein n=4 Tax=Ancylostoma ceylanicum TaxID=53326 RepID=A0A016SN30_9BILA|nr:hypothetical protein Y032_0199g1666 [Ancylostoma ceylanicum]